MHTANGDSCIAFAVQLLAFGVQADAFLFSLNMHLSSSAETMSFMIFDTTRLQGCSSGQHTGIHRPSLHSATNSRSPTMAGGKTTSNGSHRFEMSATQPHSYLHAVPQEIRDMIYAFAVISPTPLSARVLLRDIDTADDTTSPEQTPPHAATTTLTQLKITPSQPPLALIDRQTRAEVLALFYNSNTFLFRLHDLWPGTLRAWQSTLRHTNYPALARQIQHIALEKFVRKTCTPQALEQREQHLYRIRIASQPGDAALKVRFEADLAGVRACALESAEVRGRCGE